MGQELPFQWARRPCSRGLWYDLAERKAALEAQQRIPAVVRADPVGIPMPAFVRAEPGGIPMPAFVPAEREGIPMPAFVPAEPEGIPDPWATQEEARIRTPVGDGAAAEPEGIPMPAFVPAEPEGIPDPWPTIQEARIRTPVGDGPAEVQQVSSRTRARSSPAVSRNKMSGAGLTSSISGGDSGSPPSGIGDLPFLTSSSISSIDVRSADPPSGMGTGDRGEPFLPPYGGLDALDQSWR